MDTSLSTTDVPPIISILSHPATPDRSGHPDVRSDLRSELMSQITPVRIAICVAVVVVTIILMIWYRRKPKKDPTQKFMNRATDLQTRADKIATALATLIRTAEQKQAAIPTGLSTTHQRQINIALEMASLHDHNDKITDITRSLQQIERGIIAKDPPVGIKRKLREESDALKALLDKLLPPAQDASAASANTFTSTPDVSAVSASTSTNSTDTTAAAAGN